MKAFGAKMGYIIGITIAVPVVIFIVNFFFLKGNNLSDEQIDNYIRNSEVIPIDIPKDAIYTNEQFTSRLHRRNSSAFFKSFTFYSEAYRKHFVLIIFTYFEKNDNIRLNTFMLKNVKITARVNKQQQSSAEYGTAQKPIPIFPKDLLDRHPDDQKFFHLSGAMYRIYVQYYLNRFTSEEDIRKLFPEQRK